MSIKKILLLLTLSNASLFAQSQEVIALGIYLEDNVKEIPKEQGNLPKWLNLDRTGIQLWKWPANLPSLFLYSTDKSPPTTVSFNNLIGTYFLGKNWGSTYSLLQALETSNGTIEKEELDHFYIWTDKNHNGIPETGELTKTNRTFKAIQTKEGKMTAVYHNDEINPLVNYSFSKTQFQGKLIPTQPCKEVILYEWYGLNNNKAGILRFINLGGNKYKVILTDYSDPAELISGVLLSGEIINGKILLSGENYNLQLTYRKSEIEGSITLNKLKFKLAGTAIESSENYNNNPWFNSLAATHTLFLINLQTQNIILSKPTVNPQPILTKLP